jgi:hypothetical protein
VQPLAPCRVGFDELRGIVAEHHGVLGADDAFAGLDVEIVEALVGGGHREPQPFLAVAQTIAGGLAFRDVARDAEQAHDFAPGIPVGNGVRFHPAPCALQAGDRKLTDPGRAFHDVLVHFGECRAIGGADEFADGAV